MVLPTSRHFSNKHYAIFATQPNLCNFHFAKCSPLKGTRLLLYEIVKYISQNLHFEQNRICMWDMATQTKLTATVCNFYLRDFACTSTAFDGWGSSKDQTKDK